MDQGAKRSVEGMGELRESWRWECGREEIRDQRESRERSEGRLMRNRVQREGVERE